MAARLRSGAAAAECEQGRDTQRGAKAGKRATRAVSPGGRHKLTCGPCSASDKTQTSRVCPSGAVKATALSGSTVIASPPGMT